MLAQLFEIDRTGRSRPMEGLRGVAVGLVFLQHYSVQFISHGHLSDWTQAFAAFFRHFGNYGVELFFVLSGYLIYSILLRRRPSFLSFMLRRAQRLYPAFLVALVVGAAIDHLRPAPKIPAGVGALTYLGANLVFLPGLLPIDPLFAVNWSLSYEWWFYAAATAVFSVFGLAMLPRPLRIALILAFACILISLSAVGLAGVPIRGLPLFAGMLLAERKLCRLPIISVPLAFLCLAGASIVQFAWVTSLLLAIGFGLLCAGALNDSPLLTKLLCHRYLRWFGNISYSYYLVHGFAVLFCLQVAFRFFPSSNIAFWTYLGPVFMLTVCFGAGLFLFVEKPLSLPPARAAEPPAAIAEHS